MKYGFRFFDNFDQYYLWRDNYIYQSNINLDILNKYLMFLEKNSINSNYKLCNEFYDLIAKHQELMVITHSMKSNDILNSGISVISELKENLNILDIGCNTAYLTSFYAKIFPNSNFVGFDISKSSILQASKILNLKQYSNLILSYDYNLLKKYKFNCIIDTQCFCNLKKNDLLNMLDLITEQQHLNVKIISISNLRNENDANIFLKLFLKKGLYIERVAPLYIDTLSGIVGYTKIIFTRKKNNIEFNLSSYFKNIRKKISVVNLFNLN